ncbi:MAG: hypothetical protein R3E50_04955 [Halioglobus sp.]
MTIAGKVNALVLAIAIAAGCILSATTFVREFAQARERLLQQASDRVASQPQLQVDIYFHDEPELRATLQAFLKLSPAVRYAVIRDTNGTVISRLQPTDTPEYALMAFDLARGSSAVVETSMNSHRSEIAPAGFSKLNTLAGGDLSMGSHRTVFCSN